MEAFSNLRRAKAPLITLVIIFVLNYFMWQNSCMCMAQTTERSSSEKIKVCDNTYGTQIGQSEGIPSLLACATLCFGNAQCESLLFDNSTNVCRLNSEWWFCPNTACSGSGLLYSRIQTYQSALCQGANGCTGQIGGVRLCEGGGVGVCDPAKGRVEVYYNNEWGTVCDDGWTTTAGNVVCSMFGYSNSMLIVGASCIYGPDAATIWLDDVACGGQESTLFSCSHLPWGEHNCVHSEDVILKCW